jgi:threonylcarbamoyladenosine tRNA methylthiotransferase MtaB
MNIAGPDQDQTKMTRFFVRNFGCRATQADGAALEAQLAERGLAASATAEGADLVVLNTCTVTAEADHDARAAIRRVHRENPAARILVTGCYAQRAPEALSKIPGVTWVVGNSHKTQIADLVAGTREAPATRSPALPYHGQILIGDIFETRDILTAPMLDPTGDRSRPNLKIQDGCHNRCSFCVIPFVRGKSRYVGADEVVAQVRAIAATYREVVLSGINLGRWGRESGSQMRLPDLLLRLLAETPIQRIRLSSVEPMDFSDDLLGLMAASPRIARHVHAPLQSGSDAILRRMHRKYRPRHYADRVTKARQWMPDAAIGADVMIGFPGESDSLFEESYRFIADQPFTYLHLFPFSARPATPAWELHRQNPVSAPAVRERMEALRSLMAEKFRAFRSQFLDRTLSAVTIEQGAGGATEAVTDNFLKLTLDSAIPANCLVSAQVTALTKEGLCGSAVAASVTLEPLPLSADR